MLLNSIVVGTREPVLALVSCLESRGHGYVATVMAETDGRFTVTRAWPRGVLTRDPTNKSAGQAQQGLTNFCQMANVAFVAFSDQELVAYFTQFLAGKGLGVFTWPDSAWSVEEKAADMVRDAELSVEAEQSSTAPPHRTPDA